MNKINFRILGFASLILFGIILFSSIPAADCTGDSNCNPAQEAVYAQDGTFHLSQLSSTGSWVEKYARHMKPWYTTEEFSFKPVLGKVKVRVSQTSIDFADVDEISLSACGAQIIPEYAFYTETNESALEDILKNDNNVSEVHEKTIELSWSIPESCKEDAILYLSANEYLTGIPVRSPAEGFLTYNLKNSGAINVDGSIGETDGVKMPNYAFYWNMSPSHPQGYTYIYVSDDSKNLYFTVDATPDNTNEPSEDFASILIQTGESVKEYRVNDSIKKWGMGGFGMTSKASYNHQYYEISIPKSEIGQGDIKFALRYFGSYAQPPPIINCGLDLCTPEEPCVVGFGDCDNNNECLEGVCDINVGLDYGCPWWVDICVSNSEESSSSTLASSSIPTSSSTTTTLLPVDPQCNIDRCSPEHPCQVGEGDCDTNNDCIESVCYINAGMDYGCPWWVDICITDYFIV